MKAFFNSLNTIFSSFVFGKDISKLEYYTENPVYEWASGDQYRDPSRIIEFNGKFYFYASKYDAGTFAGDTSEEIAVFEANTWDGNYTYQGVVLSKSVSDLDNRTVFTPDVIVKDGTIYLFYTGGGTVNSERWNGFLATSNDPKGTFVRYSANPIIYNSIDGVGETWEDFRIDALTPVLLPNRKIRVYYKGVKGVAGGIIARKFGYADYDAFPGVLIKSSNNPFYDATDTYNGTDPESPSVWYQNFKFWMVYATTNSDGFGFISSPNGVDNWVEEDVILETITSQGFGFWHGVSFYLNNKGNCQGVLFHDGPGNDDVREISLLKIIK